MWILTSKNKSFTGYDGFTLVELLVVVVIIGILVAVALPQYNRAVAKARMRQTQAIMGTMKEAEELYYLYMGTYTNDTNRLDIDIPQCPKDAVYHNVPVCGKWLVDPIDGTPSAGTNSIRAAYCPHVADQKGRWDDCANEADYYMIYWLDHSAHPGQIECTAKTDLGQALCDSMGT